MADSPGPVIVAIDGPAGAGKSTVARVVADRLELPVLETGAMYRTAGLHVLNAGIDLDDEAAVEAAVVAMDLDLVPGAGGRIEVHLDGRAVGDRIRAPEVGEATSRISVHGGVRRRMVELQRHAARGGAVVEGRDIGTVVFPDTPHKFFLDASVEVRAARRVSELRAAGRDADAPRIAEQMAARDRRDRERADSPLTRDDSYAIIDTDALTRDQVAAVIVERVLGLGSV